MANFRHPDKRAHTTGKGIVDLIPLLEGELTRKEREALRNALLNIETQKRPTSRSVAITDELTTITHTAPGTEDYAIQALTNSSPYGFVSQDEGHTMLQVIANLQARVNELEQVLIDQGLLNG